MTSIFKQKAPILYWLNKQNDQESYELMVKIISNYNINAQVLKELIEEKHYQLMDNLKQLNPNPEMINRFRNLIKLSFVRLIHQEEISQKRLNVKRQRG